jgi:ATP-dependent Clp protease ATP-binding subunit ClpA
MFERFTDRARRVVVLTQEEARLLNHNYIGTEHLLLALVRDDEGVAALALQQLGISHEAVRGQVEDIIGRGGSSPSDHMPFTPRSKKVLELSLREALQLGHDFIGTEHLLLGLVREGEGVAAQVLAKMGTNLAQVRSQVMELLGQAPGEPPLEPIPREDIARAVEAAPLLPVPAEKHPVCPHCRTPLAEEGAVRVLAVPDLQAGHSVPAQVVYCQVCGRALGALGL